MAFESLAVLAAIAAAVAVACASAAESGRKTEKKQSEFDEFWDTSMKQDDFDGMTLPEDSESPRPVTSTQLTPVIVKVGQRYGVPFTEPLTKQKHHGLKDTYMDHLLGASIGSVIAFGSLAMVVMAGKALLMALGAILLTCLGSGWKGGAMTHKSDKTGAVYEVVAKPQISQGHSYSAEVHYEPYAPLPTPTAAYKDFAYGYRHL